MTLILFICYELCSFYALGWIFLCRLRLRRDGIAGVILTFLLGFIIYPVLAYPLFALLHAARIAHLFLAVGIILALFATVLHKPGMATQSSWWDAYHEKLREFLRHPLGKAALAGVVLLGILCVITRLPWMLELRQHDTVSIGTGIYDDMRTIGFPIALAVKGFPLLSPYATTVGLHYPMGGFFFTGGVIATLHGNPLLPIQADIFVSVLFLVLTLLLVTVSVISQPSLRFLALLSMLITTAFDHRLIKHGWNERLFHFLYGYGIERPDWQTTLTWTTYTALLWLLNHAVAAVALLFIISLLAPGEEVLEEDSLHFDADIIRKTIVAGFIACMIVACSLDMGVMLLTFVALLLFVCIAWHARVLRQLGLLRGSLASILVTGACATLYFIAVNYPALFHLVDSPYEHHFGHFPNPTMGYNLAFLLSGFGIYLLLFALIFSFPVKPEKGKTTTWIYLLPILLFPCLLSVFWTSIWFWRAPLLLHWTFPLLLASMISHRVLHSWRYPAYLTLWLVALIPGTGQLTKDVCVSVQQAPRISPAQAQVYKWIYAHTDLHDRVVAYLPKEHSLAPDVNYLRLGNRAGDIPFDRIHALIGYRRYLREMKDLAHGIAGNDYIIVWEADSEMHGIMTVIHARVLFENSTASIYAIDASARHELDTPQTRHLISRIEEQYKHH